jgi:hypothetical protein
MISRTTRTQQVSTMSLTIPTLKMGRGAEHTQQTTIMSLILPTNSQIGGSVSLLDIFVIFSQAGSNRLEDMWSEYQYDGQLEALPDTGMPWANGIPMDDWSVVLRDL